MGNKRKSLKNTANKNLALSSRQQENINSSAQKSRKSNKKRKTSSKNVNGTDSLEDLGQQQQDQLQQTQTKIPTSSKLDSRAQTLSPDKTKPTLFKLDSTAFTKIQSPKNISQLKSNPTGLKNEMNVNSLDNSVKHQRETSSQLSIANNQQRPYTSGLNSMPLKSSQQAYNVEQHNEFQQQLVNSQSQSLAQSNKLEKKKFLQINGQANINPIVDQRFHGGVAQGASYIQGNNGKQLFSPLKNTYKLGQQQHNVSSTNINNQASQYQLGQESNEGQQILKQQQFQHILNHQQQQNTKFQQSMAEQKANQFQLAHQVGINGLLNMSKQRGLISNHPSNMPTNLRNSPGNPNLRSQSSQKQQPQPNQQLQNNGKIIAHKSPLYNSLPVQITGIQGDLLIQPNKLYNKNPQYHYAIHNQQAYFQQQMAQQQQQQMHNSQNITPQRYPNQPRILNSQNNISLIQQQLLQKASRPIVGSQPQNNYYYFDQPVQISGKQIGLPVGITQHSYAKQDKTPLYKKSSYSGIQNSLLDPNPQSLMIHYDPMHLQQDEMLKQAIIQELMENQQIPPQMYPQHQQSFQGLESNQMARNQYFQGLVQNASMGSTEKIQEVKNNGGPNLGPKKSKIPFSNAYVEDCYKFIVVPGNNSGLVRKAIERRDWWIEIPAVHSLYNFKWQPVSYGIKFERLSPMKPKPGEIGSQYVSQPLGNGGGNPLNDQQSSDNVFSKQMVNHFEFHQLITEKANLFNIMKQYCESQKENIFDLCPLTFYIEITDKDKIHQSNPSLQQFLQVYQALEESKERMKQIEQMIHEYKSKQKEQPNKDTNSGGNEEDEDQAQGSTTGGESTTNNGGNHANNKEKEFIASLNNKGNSGNNNSKVTKFKTFNFEKRTSTKYSFPLCHYTGFNLWLLKPTHLNRGRGIHVFRDIDDLLKLMKEYSQGKDEEVKSVAKKESKNQVIEESGEVDLQLGDDQESPGAVQEQAPQTKKKSSPKKLSNNAYKIKHNTFIIQKYIEKPLLLYGRKFDIRVWVLLNQDYDLFFFKEGYLRTSSSEFKINLNNIDDQYVHLTNNAVQKFSENYGQFEDGNQLGYKRFQQIIDDLYPAPGTKKCPISVKEDIVPQMKELIIKSMYSVRKKIDPYRRKSCFELFGYDFILDEDFNVWLIEVNTNPCIEESSELLKVYLPRMIEDMLRLTIDQVFPKIKKRHPQAKSSQMSSPQKASSKIKNPSANNSGTQQAQLDKIEEEDNIQGDSIQTHEDQDKQAQSKETHKKNQRIHPVEGYSNTENMWEKIWNMEKSDAPPNKYPNFRSEFLININDKQFKIKRNPLFKKIQKDLMQQQNESHDNERVKHSNKEADLN